MGFFDSIARVMGSPGASDAQLVAQYEALRLRWLSTQSFIKSERLRATMRGLDDEMVRRANKAYLRSNPNATTRYSAGGWYLPSDD